ncbi:MAG: hypothetical protein HZA63_05020 [Rhodocyclales bacterium]|nr:hypothetical protein [Rhodocyclales bacterium]
MLALLMGAGVFYSTVVLAVLLNPSVFWKTHAWPLFDWSTLLQVSLPQCILAAAALLHLNAWGAEADRDERETSVVWMLRGGSLGAFACGIAYLASGYIVLYLFESALGLQIALAMAGFFGAKFTVGANGPQ